MRNFAYHFIRFKSLSNQRNYSCCSSCLGQGKKKGKIRKKGKKANSTKTQSIGIKENEILLNEQVSHEILCKYCKGTGLIQSETMPNADELKYPKIAIIGAGIGGAALAVACSHRGIPFTLFERDVEFNSRSQGYGLTLQQASKAMYALGIDRLEEGIVSTKHIVHTTDGKILGEWGMRKWDGKMLNIKNKRTNIHIARQALRAALFNQFTNVHKVGWNHQLVNLEKRENSSVEVTFKVGQQTKKYTFDMIVGADGIRSTVRNFIFEKKSDPLRYLNCMVILGICPLEKLNHLNNSLLDGATVFQTANGNDRIYMMPFDTDHVMWQLSFPIDENTAKKLNKAGAKQLKKEAILRTQWHCPIPEIVEGTSELFISGYPVYDREVIIANSLKDTGNITLIGDAAHPMSPFKGQGANQAILDALSLARQLTKSCRLNKQPVHTLRTNMLTIFEHEMFARSAVKVKSSAEAASILHTEKVLLEGNITRGSISNSNDN